MSSFMHACMHAYIHILFKISSRIHKYFWSISLNVPIVRTCVSRHVLETSKYNKAIIEVNKRVREIVEYKNHAFSKTSMPKWQNTSIQERKKEKNAQTQSKLPVKDFSKPSSSSILRSFSICKIYLPLVKLMEISTSPHFVNSSDTNDPNGSTSAPVWARTLIYVVNNNKN